MRSLPRTRASLLPLVALAAVFSTIETEPGWAATIVVDQAGSGDYTSIAPAVAAAIDGDEVHILAGVYQTYIGLDKSITLSCEGPDVVTLRHDAGDTIHVERNRSVTITGCTITGAGTGIALKRGSVTRITNNVIVGNADGIAMFAYENTVEAIIVTNNVVASNRGDAFDVFDNNALCSNTANSVWIMNNIVYNNAACGFHSSCLGGRTLAYKNVIGNSTDYCTGTRGIRASDCFNCISETPGFVDLATGDYRLTSGSTSRNRGNPVAADLDPDGTRNDLGAYGGPDSAPFFPSPDQGPTIRSLSILPSSLPQGGTIHLQATGRVTP